ncbi:MAG: hypothetical protein JWN10_2434 [Solirubrobacterales bacterium]|nr:hypothetical protein [Solirubrobacterales bacterium]
MLTFAAGTKVFLSTESVDLRRGHDGLCSLVKNVLALDPFGLSLRPGRSGAHGAPMVTDAQVRLSWSGDVVASPRGPERVYPPALAPVSHCQRKVEMSGPPQSRKCRVALVRERFVVRMML